MFPFPFNHSLYFSQSHFSPPILQKKYILRIFFTRPRKEFNCCANHWSITQRATATSFLWGVGEKEAEKLYVFFNKEYFWNHNEFTLLRDQKSFHLKTLGNTEFDSCFFFFPVLCIFAFFPFSFFFPLAIHSVFISEGRLSINKSVFQLRPL